MRGLYAITDAAGVDIARLVQAVEQAILGGARVVQYRDKAADPARREAAAHALSAVCRRRHVVFIVNDDVALARRVAADGVHLGAGDSSVGEARAVLGGRALIGVSCYNRLDLAVAAQAQGANYVAFGSFFPSPTKPLAVTATPDVLVRARQALAVPVVAIGGITPENGRVLVEAGADMLAVVSGVFGAADVADAARRYARLFLTDNNDDSRAGL